MFFRNIIISDQLKENAKIAILHEKSGQYPEESLRALLLQEDKTPKNSLVHIIVSNQSEEVELLQALLELPHRLLAAKTLKKSKFLTEEKPEFFTSTMTNLKNIQLRPLYYASKKNFISIAQILIKFGADINGKSLDINRTPLHVACMEGHDYMAEMLLRQGANLKESQTDGRDSLMLAALHEHPDIIKLLIKFGANLNHQDKRGFTVLQYAVESGNIEISSELLKYYPNIEIKNQSDKNVLELAEIHGYSDIYDIIANYKSQIQKLSLEKVMPAKSDLPVKKMLNLVKNNPCHIRF